MIFEIYPRDHLVHSNLVHYKLKHSYLNIPVNSSSWGRQTFESVGFVNDHTRTIPNDHTIVVFLRDPIDRWLSGIATWLTVHFPQHTPMTQIRDNTALLDSLFQIVRLDPHTEQQLWFLQNLPRDNMKFFWVDSTLSDSVTNYLSTVIKRPVAIFPPNHVSTIDGGKLIPKNYFRSVLESNPHYLKQVKKYFYDDYCFIKDQTFENCVCPKFQYYDSNPL